MKISNSPIASCLLALACFSTSATAAEAPAPPSAAAEHALELEVALAETPSLYLVVHLAQRRLEIKARGLVLDSVALADVALTRYTPLGAASLGPVSAELPAVRAIVESDVATARRVVTVATLTPYPKNGAEEEEAPAAEASPTRSPVQQADPAPPSSYRARLEGDWELWIDQRGIRPSAGQRLILWLGGTGRWLVGKPQQGSVILGLAMTAEDARRLHHLFDSGSMLLVR